MTTKEYNVFEACVKNVKYIAIVNQNYEFAARLRDLEKDLTQTTDWQRVNSLDSLQYYDRIERLIDEYSTDKTNEELRFNLKQVYDVVMRPVIRQEIISKILGEENE